MTHSQLADIVRIHKALGHAARMRIMAMIRGGELCACQITAVLNLAPSTVSAHLAELRRANLIQERKDGRWVYYSLGQEVDAAEIVELLWNRIRTDRQVSRDAKLVERLRTLPVEELCRADLDASQVMPHASIEHSGEA